MPTLVEATDGNRPFTIARNGSMIILSRRSTKHQKHDIAFNATDLYRVLDAAVDIAEQIEQDNN